MFTFICYFVTGSTTAAPPSKKRGKFRGLKASNLFKSAGDQRIKIHFDPDGKKPIGEHSSLLITELGLLTRTMIPLSMKKWSDVPATLRDDLIQRVDVRYLKYLYFYNGSSILHGLLFSQLIFVFVNYCRRSSFPTLLPTFTGLTVSMSLEIDTRSTGES